LERKRQPSLYDYVANGIVGFAIGISTYFFTFIVFVFLSLMSAIFQLYTTIYSGLVPDIWGWAVLIDLFTAIFGYLPGGFFGGYLFLKTFDFGRPEIERMEGAKVGAVSYAIFFIASLILNAFTASMLGLLGGNLMGIWGVSVLFALSFVAGGYLAGYFKSTMLVTSPAAPRYAPPYTYPQPPRQPSARHPSIVSVTQYCPNCRTELPQGSDHCPKCGTRL